MKMKVAFIGHRDLYFGAESVLFRVIRLLKAKDLIDPLVILPISIHNGFSKRCIAADIKYLKHLPYKLLNANAFRSALCLIFNSYALFKLFLCFRKQNVNLIYTNTSVNVIGPLLALLLNKPHFWHFHEQPTQGAFTWIPKVFYPLYRFLLLRKNNTLIFISNTQKKLWEKELGMPIPNSEIIYTPPEREFKLSGSVHERQGFDNGIPLLSTSLLPEVLNEWPLPGSAISSNAVVFGFLGSWTLSKNLALLLSSFAALMKAHPASALRLILMGEGEQELWLRAEVLRLGIREQVTFMPYSSVTEPFFAAIDIFVLPSFFESWGLVALEAIAAKKALIITANTSLTEILQAGKDCLVINPQQQQLLKEDSLYVAMEQLLLHPVKRNHLADHASSTLKQLQLHMKFEASMLSLFKW
jgi:glycosyltransferase involved in cell wall biosynthesis